MNFSIKIPGNISFQIGIIDAWGNQSYVNFPSDQTTYGLIRNGEWGQASIPVAEIRGEFIDLRMLSYEFVILEVNGASCEFGLDDIYWSGGGEILEISDFKNPLYQFELKNNYPNPFNPLTLIKYSLPSDGVVTITIYDMMGSRVKTLINSFQKSGDNSVQWDATNNLGNKVPSGVYLYNIEAGNFNQTKKMVLLK